MGEEIDQMISKESPPSEVLPSASQIYTIRVVGLS